MQYVLDCSQPLLVYSRMCSHRDLWAFERRSFDRTLAAAVRLSKRRPDIVAAAVVAVAPELVPERTRPARTLGADRQRSAETVPSLSMKWSRSDRSPDRSRSRARTVHNCIGQCAAAARSVWAHCSHSVWASGPL